jgi:hypothetical protein
MLSGKLSNGLVSLDLSNMKSGVYAVVIGQRSKTVVVL